MIPRIEVTNIFAGSSPAEIRLSDFDRYHCNDSYYDVAITAAEKRCQELFAMAGTLIHDGAARKSNTYTKFLSYQTRFLNAMRLYVSMSI